MLTEPASTRGLRVHTHVTLSHPPLNFALGIQTSGRRSVQLLRRTSASDSQNGTFWKRFVPFRL